MSQAVVARAFHPGNWEAEDLCKFEPSLVYRLSSRAATATEKPRLQKQKQTISKNNNKNKMDEMVTSNCYLPQLRI